MAASNTAPVVVSWCRPLGEADETVTSSDIWPISSFWSMPALKPVSMMTFWRTPFLKLASSNVTV